MEILTNLLSVVMTALCTYTVWILQQNRTKKDHSHDALKILLKSQLKEYYLEYTERGYVTTDELDACIEIYETYHNLGGNGTGTKMIEDVKRLPIKED